MKKMTESSLSIGLFLFCLQAAPAAAQSTLHLRPGSMFIGGSVSLTRTQSLVDDATGSVGVTRTEVNPVAGVFVGRTLALTASALWMKREVEKRDDTTWGATLGLRTHARTGSGFLYLGAELLYDSYLSETRYWQIGLRLGAGWLVPLHRHLALDAGLRMSLLRGKLETDDMDSGFSTAVLQIGYLGVVGFFDL